MKKILIITYFFPPMNEIGGIRIYGLTKNLLQFGWDPIILIPDHDNFVFPSLKINKTPYDDVIGTCKKILKLNPYMPLKENFNILSKRKEIPLVSNFIKITNDIIAYPDSAIGWYKYAITEGENIIKANKIDAIISSSPPVTCHLIANFLSKKYNIPWIADFRDLWSQNHYSNKNFIIKRLEKKLEIKTIKRAYALSSVSIPLTKKLHQIHLQKNIQSIPNGFDIDQLNPGITPDKKFSIVYTGIFYQGKRDPKKIFSVIKKLINDIPLYRKDIRIDIYGNIEYWIYDLISYFGFHDIVFIHGPIPRDMAIEVQRKAQILLLLTWDNPEDNGVYTGKLFDYLAAKRPIIVPGGSKKSVIKELLEKTNAGIYACNEIEIEDYLIQAYQEYKKFGKVIYRGIIEEIMKYSHIEMTKSFAYLFNQVIDGK